MVGFDLPMVMYTPHRDERWRKMSDATWLDLTESMKLRDKHIAEQIEEAAVFAQALDILRPLMEADPDLTVGEALDRLSSA